MIKLGPGHRYRFEYARCTGCEACFEQCPVHAIEMVPELALMRRHDRRQRGGGVGRLPAQRGLLRSTRSRRPRRWPNLPTSGPAGGSTNVWGTVPAVVEMQSEGGAAGALHGALQGGCAGDDVHRVAGPAADDPEHVQDRRRADAGGVPRRGAFARCAGAVDLRRPLRRDGGAPDRIRAAGLRLGAGGSRPGGGRARCDARDAAYRSCTSSTAFARRTS